MKYVAWLLILIAIIAVYVSHVSRPVIIEGELENGRQYFCTYEVRKGETYEQVKDEVSHRR